VPRDKPLPPTTGRPVAIKRFVGGGGNFWLAWYNDLPISYVGGRVRLEERRLAC
jgi:hypothetical protein